MKSTRADAGEDAVAVRLDTLVDDMARAAQAIAAGRPEGIHRLRVAIRRVRSCLRTFRPLFERARSEAVRGELAWMSGVLAEARDPEVLARRLERRLDRLDVTERMGPVRPELVGERRAAAQRGRANVMAALQTDRYAHLIDELAAFARHPAYRPGRSGLDRRSLVRCARKEVRRAGRLADRAAGRPPGPPRDGAFHEVRKAAKRVRYAAEALAPLSPHAARRLASRFERIQDLLGERQDAAVARRFLVAEGARVGVQPAHNGFTYGLLAAEEKAAMRDVDGLWPEAWRKATRPKVRRFLAE